MLLRELQVSSSGAIRLIKYPYLVLYILDVGIVPRTPEVILREAYHLPFFSTVISISFLALLVTWADL